MRTRLFFACLQIVVVAAVLILGWPSVPSARADEPAPLDASPTLEGTLTAPPSTETPTPDPVTATLTAEPAATGTALPEGTLPATEAGSPTPAATIDPGATLTGAPDPATPTTTVAAATTEPAATATDPATPATATDSPPQSAMPSATPMPSIVAPESATPSATPTLTGTATFTPTPSATASPTFTPTPTPLPASSATPAVLSPEPPQAEAPASRAGTPSTTLVISQVYGGGGNAGAPYRNDFIELRNLGPSAVDLGGWSVQYAPATSGSWQSVALAGLVQPGSTYLLQLGSGGGEGAALPAPEAAHSLNIAASAGKVALVSEAAPLAGSCPDSALVVDFLGYGVTASCYETAPTGNLSAGAAAHRMGPADTDHNAVDFGVAAPSPHGNVVSPPTSTTTPTPTPTPTVTPTLPVTVTATATPTASSTISPAAPGSVLINEVVTDPQQDWSGGGFGPVPGAGPVSDTDEWIELLILADGLDLTAWTLELRDGSDVSGDLTEAGAFQVVRYLGAGSAAATRAGDRLVLGNVRGSGTLNNAVTVQLLDSHGGLIDAVTLGGGAPSGDADSAAEEAVARRPDGAGLWVRQAATPGQANDLAPQPTPTATATATVTPTAAATPSAYPAGAVLINEVAWAGTAASANDEWLELFNPGPIPIALAGWRLSDGGDIDLSFPPGLAIPAGGFLLLERTDDSTIADVPADLLYSGGLSNGGETLVLRDATGSVIDIAAGAGGWPAGDAALFATMERAGGGWRTQAGAATGHAADGSPLRGTPRGLNSAYRPAPTPVSYPATVLLNEVLPAPGDGSDEFVEVFNTGAEAVDVSGWQLDDSAGGSAPFHLPAGTVVGPRALLAFSKSETGLAFNNSGDTARLLHPDGGVADELVYTRSPGVDVSWARVPDGGAWAATTQVTPGLPNTAAPPAEGGPPADSGAPEQEAASVPIGVFRTWPAGAWATLTGRVTVPAPLFGPRQIYLQDETGGIAVYLGRGDWPALPVGQSVTVLGYSRVRSGRFELYVRTLFQVDAPPMEGGAGIAPAPGPVGPGTAGSLLTLTGRVVKLESTAFWLDAGAGPVRVFFAASTGVRRPKVARGDIWTVTGVVVEMTATKTRAAGYQLQPRFAADVQPVRARYVAAPEAETPTPPEETPPDEAAPSPTP